MLRPVSQKCLVASTLTYVPLEGTFLLAVCGKPRDDDTPDVPARERERDDKCQTALTMPGGCLRFWKNLTKQTTTTCKASM